jgi:hypothetical protein
VEVPMKPVEVKRAAEGRGKGAVVRGIEGRLVLPTHRLAYEGG